jgi:hypothetical protein
MLARMGSLLELKADKPKSEMLHNFKGMETARQALIKDRIGLPSVELCLPLLHTSL